MKDIYEDINDYILELEKDGLISPDCKMCKEIFYPQLRADMSFHIIFAPRHKPAERCESGKRPHCTCDVCF